MSVIGHLRRSALGAGGVALLLPLGLALGVGLTAALGGEARLRALGQVVAGPNAPDRARAPGLESTRAVPSVPVRTRPAPTTGPSNRPMTPVQQPSGGGEPAAPSDPGTTPEPGTPSPPSGPTPTEPATPEPSQPQPPAEPDPGGSPLNDAAQDTADAVGQVPVVGEITDDAMQTVVDLIP